MGNARVGLEEADFKLRRLKAKLGSELQLRHRSCTDAQERCQLELELEQQKSAMVAERKARESLEFRLAESMANTRQYQGELTQKAASLTLANEANERLGTQLQCMSEELEEAEESLFEESAACNAMRKTTRASEICFSESTSLLAREAAAMATQSQERLLNEEFEAALERVFRSDLEGRLLLATQKAQEAEELLNREKAALASHRDSMRAQEDYEMQLAQTDARLAQTEQELSMQRRESQAMRLERSAWQDCEATLLAESAQAEHARLHDDLEVRLAEAGVQLSHMESELAQERLVAQEDESADGRRRLQKREENQAALDLERDVWRVSEMQATEEIRASLQDIEQKLRNWP